MAIRTVLEKASGSVTQMQQPVVVYDDTGAFLHEENAFFPAYAAAPDQFFGVPHDAIPTVQRLAPNAVRYTINYRMNDPKPKTKIKIGEERFQFDFFAEQFNRQWAPEVARFPNNAPSSGGIMNIKRQGNSVTAAAAVIEPPRANLRKEVAVALALVNAAWARTIASVIGAVNSVPIGVHSVGEVMLVQVAGNQVDDLTMQLQLGWAWKPNVTGEARGDVEDIEYNGHDYTWDLHEPVVDRDENVLAMKPVATYVHRVHPYADITAIGILPP